MNDISISWCYYNNYIDIFISITRSISNEGFKFRENDKKVSVNSVLQKEPKISTQTTCDSTIGGICYIDGMPKIVDIIANVVEDEHYKNVFKKIRSYTPSNIYQCVDKVSPLMSVKPLCSLYN